MCQMIYFPGGDIATSVGELSALLGGRPVCDERDTNIHCLCGTDVIATARKVQVEV